MFLSTLLPTRIHFQTLVVRNLIARKGLPIMGEFVFEVMKNNKEKTDFITFHFLF
jgi:hypothetical protein